MQSTRETIYSTLFAYFSQLSSGGSPLFVTTTRRVKKWADVTPEQTPALFQTQVKEIAEKITLLPTTWRYHVELYVYVATGGIDDETIPSQLLNPLLDAIENSLEPDQFASWTQTLDYLPGIHEARIQGETEISEGVLGTTAIARVPIEIVVLS